MIEAYDPREGQVLSLLDEQGTLAPIPAGMPRLSDEQALAAYKTMVLARQADEWALSLNRQGRMPTYALNKGQEANSIGALMALRPDDWFVPAFQTPARLHASWNSPSDVPPSPTNVMAMRSLTL